MGCGSAKISSSSVRNQSSPHPSSIGYGEEGTPLVSNASPGENSEPCKVKPITYPQSDFSTATGISGNSRIRVTLSGDGSLLEIETERLLENEDDFLYQRISDDSGEDNNNVCKDALMCAGNAQCPGCSPDQPSTSNNPPKHTCTNRHPPDLGDTFIYHRHILDNSLLSNHRTIHSSLPDFRKLYTGSDKELLMAVCRGNQFNGNNNRRFSPSGTIHPNSRDRSVDHASQTTDHLPNISSRSRPSVPKQETFLVEQLPESPRYYRYRKPCTASKGYTCLEYCAKECYKHTTSIQRTDSTLIGITLPVAKPNIASNSGSRKSFLSSSSGKQKSAFVKRSRTFDVPPDGGIIRSAQHHPPIGAIANRNGTSHPVKRSSTFDGAPQVNGSSVTGATLPNGDVRRSNTYDNVNKRTNTSESGYFSMFANLTGNKNRIAKEAASLETGHISRLKRFSRQNSVQSGVSNGLSRENSEQSTFSQSTRSTILSRQTSAQSAKSASSPDSDFSAVSIESKLRRRLFGKSKFLPEVVNSSLPSNTSKYSVGQHGRKGPVLKASSWDYADEGLDLTMVELQVHQDFYNDFGDLFDDDGYS